MRGGFASFDWCALIYFLVLIDTGVLERCELGCFLLTEHGAGVLSGLIVQTVCTWNGNGFTLDSAPPVERSRKSWISQGNSHSMHRFASVSK